MQQHSSIRKDLTSMGVTHTRLNRRMEMGNSLVKPPLTSLWEQWEEEEKQSNEDIYSHIWIAFMSQNCSSS